MNNSLKSKIKTIFDEKNPIRLKAVDIKKYEQTFNMPLSEEYRFILQNYSGIFLLDDYLFKPINPSPLAHNGLEEFDTFLGFYGEDNIFDVYEMYKPQLPPNLYPLCNVTGGNLLCISGSDNGIYMWIHDMPEDNCIFHSAYSLTDFIERVEYHPDTSKKNKTYVQTELNQEYIARGLEVTTLSDGTQVYAHPDFNQGLAESMLKFSLEDKPFKEIEQSAIKNCYEQLLIIAGLSSYGYESDIFIEKEKELSLVIPNQLKCFFSYFECLPSIRNMYYTFYNVEQLKTSYDRFLKQNVLIFGSSNENGEFCIIEEHVKFKEPGVCLFINDRLEVQNRPESGLGAFLFNTICYHVLLTMQYKVFVSVDSKKFYSRTLDKKHLFSFNNSKSITKGCKMCACHDQNKKIIGVFYKDYLYLGSNDQDGLNAFLKTTKWKYEQM